MPALSQRDWRGPAHCEYCQRAFSDTVPPTWDHIIPKSRGGRDRRENLVASCERCNSDKANQLLSEWVDRWYYRTLNEVKD